MHQSPVVAMQCLFVSDLHGSSAKYQKLFFFVKKTSPDAVFFGGDLLPMVLPSSYADMESFIHQTILNPLHELKQWKPDLHFFLIMGNDDPRKYEPMFKHADSDFLIHYMHQRTVSFHDLFVTGYSFVPPTPFQLKDWERYDVSRFVDVGAISPEQGVRSIDVDLNTIKYATIQKDLKALVKNAPPEKTIYLFHSPPYNTVLDHADLIGETIDHVPVDVHIGSIAIRRFIEQYQPFLTLHGHVHESSQLTGEWKHSWERSLSFNAAFTHEKLAIVSFDTNNPMDATRTLIPL